MITEGVLRISLQDSGDIRVMKLEGCLAGACVREAFACWRRVSADGNGRSVDVDLTDLCHVDEEGRKLMMLMHLDGARFRTAGCVMPEIVREISEAASAGYSFVWRS